MDNINKLFKLLKDAPQKYLSQTPEDKREIVKLLCSNLFYDGENITIELKSAFEYVFKNAINFKMGG